MFLKTDALKKPHVLEVWCCGIEVKVNFMDQKSTEHTKVRTIFASTGYSNEYLDVINPAQQEFPWLFYLLDTQTHYMF